MSAIWNKEDKLPRDFVKQVNINNSDYHVLEIERAYSDKIISYTNLFVEQNNSFLEIIHNIALSIFKGLFILNGAAAVAMLAMSNSFVADKEIHASVLSSVYLMAWGVLSTVFSSIIFYIVNYCYYSSHKNYCTKTIAEMNLSMLEAIEQTVTEDENKKDFLKNKKDEFSKMISLEGKKYKNNKLIGHILNFSMVIPVIISCCLFVQGITKVKESFNSPRELYELEKMDKLNNQKLK